MSVNDPLHIKYNFMFGKTYNTNLRELDVTQEQIKEIPDNLKNLVNLQFLILSHNQIREIPDSLSNLINLVFLSLNYNKIKQIPGGKICINLYKT